jgi:alpha-amylase
MLNGRSPNYLYQPVGTKSIKALLKNYRLSDDIAFRFSDKGWAEFPLTVDKYKEWVFSVAGNGETINLFMDYETFGEHQWESTGIFNFLDHLPGQILAHPDFDFKTPSEVINSYPARDVYDAHNFISWADTERDLSAWLSNPMQHEAMKRIYSLETDVKASGNKDLLKVWERLTTSDHFYYMCTKFWSDGDVHKYFSPFDSPYDAYMFYMNVFSDLECQVKTLSRKQPQPARPMRPVHTITPHDVGYNKVQTGAGKSLPRENGETKKTVELKIVENPSTLPAKTTKKNSLRAASTWLWFC